jgi:hypothetical protein
MFIFAQLLYFINPSVSKKTNNQNFIPKKMGIGGDALEVVDFFDSYTNLCKQNSKGCKIIVAIPQTTIRVFLTARSSLKNSSINNLVIPSLTKILREAIDGGWVT